MHLRRTARLPALLVMVAAVAVLGGCRPATPSESQWHQQATDALEAVASELATAELALDAQRGDRLPGRTGVMLLVHAEEAAGTEVQKFTGRQPPKALQSRHDEVCDALQAASALITEARTAGVRHDAVAYGDLVGQLARERHGLVRLEERVR